MKGIIFSMTLLSFLGCTSTTETQEPGQPKQASPSIQQVWATDTLLRTPESVLFDREREVIYVANVNMNPWEKDGNGDYLASSWRGELFYIAANWQRSQLLDTQEAKINAADIDYAIEHKLLLVPTFFDKRVVAYQLTK